MVRLLVHCVAQKWRAYGVWGWKKPQPYELNYLPPGHPLNNPPTNHPEKVCGDGKD